MLLFLRMLMLLWHLEVMTDSDDKPEEESEDQEPEEEEVIRNPRKYELSREAAAWRKKFRDAEARVKELEAERNSDELVGALRSSRMESAFLRSALQRGEAMDVQTAWDLLHARGFADAVTVTDDGQVEGMDEAIGRVLDRYPWLAEPPPEESDDQPHQRTASPPRKRVDKAGQRVSEARLSQRFPALKGK